MIKRIGKAIESLGEGLIARSGGSAVRSSAVNSAVTMSGTYGGARKPIRQAAKLVNPRTGLPVGS